MTQSFFRRLVLGMMATVSTAITIYAQEPQVLALPIDTAVRIGKLDNGLTYFIRRNKLPEGRAHFYISQKVGSMQEEENQRGLAHFLEHIAFNGTKHFPGKGIINYLETLGANFGSDINAYTGFDETVYTLMNIPVSRQSTVDSCLLILHDWSNSISLEDKEIDDERGVIQEEWRSRDNGNFRAMMKAFTDAFQGNKYGSRMPIGLMDVVRNFKYQELRDYYKKWYRPDLQGLIIVGDIDPVQVEATIKRLFADVPKPVNPAERVYVPVEDHTGVLAVIGTDKEAVGTRISVEFKADVMPAELKASQVGLMTDYIYSLISSMIRERFLDITKKPNAPFRSASAYFNEFQGVARTKDALTFEAVANDGKYQDALKGLVMEIERLSQFGFNKGEYERAKKDYLVSLKKAYNERDKRKNQDYAEEYSQYFLRGGYIPGIEFEYQFITTLADQIPLEAVNQAIKEAITQNNIVVSLTGPDKADIKYPTTEALKNEFNSYRALKVEALKEETSNIPLMAKKPKAGKIVKVDKAGKYGSTVWTLSNGVKVIIKPTDFKEDEIQVSGMRQGGTSTFAKKDELEARAMGAVMNLGGLASFDENQLEKVLSGRLASAGPSISLTSEAISGSSTKEDLETMFQLIYLNFTQKRTDKQAFEVWKENALNSLKMKEANPMSSVSDSIGKAIYPGDKRHQSFTEAEYKALKYERIMQMYKERFSNANGFQFVFVGNIDEAKLRPLVETYLASLPATKVVSKADFSKYPVTRKGNYVNHYYKKQETPMGLVFDMYSGKLEVNMRNRLAFNILAEVLDQVYMDVIREREGGTYGAQVGSELAYEPKGDASLTVVFQTDPTKAEHLNKIAQEELQKLAKDGLDRTKFDKVILNMEKQYNTNQKENSYWLRHLVNYYYHGRDGVTDYLSTLKSIKPEDSQKLLQQLLEQKNYIEVMLLPEGQK